MLILPTLLVLIAQAEPAPIVIDRVNTDFPDPDRALRLFHGDTWTITGTFIVDYLLHSPVVFHSVQPLPCAGQTEGDVRVDVGGRSLNGNPGFGLHVIRKEQAGTPTDIFGLSFQAWEDEPICLRGLEIKDAAGRVLPIVAPRVIDATITAPQTHSLPYHALRMIDHDLTTAWSTKGKGKGAVITFGFAADLGLTGLRLRPGYHRSEELWTENASPARITVTAGTQNLGTFELPTTMQKDAVVITFPERVTAREVTLRVDEVRAGTRYQDMLVSELRFVDGDSDLVINPTPHLREVERAHQDLLDKAGLGELTTGRLGTTDWSIELRRDGIMLVSSARAKDGTIYKAQLSWELVQSGKGQITLRYYGAAHKGFVPVMYGDEDLGKRETKTINGKLTIKKVGKDYSVSRKGADSLPLPGGTWKLSNW